MPDTTSQSLSEAALTEFDYLLNRYTAAAQAERPADHNFKTHRDALYAYVRRMEGIAKQRELDAKAEPMGHVLHSGHGDHYKRGPQRPSDLMHAGRYVWTPVYAHPPAAQDREPTGWLPMETAPRDGTRVILEWAGKPINGFYLDNSKTDRPWAGWRTESMVASPPGDPTGWMPFPAARAAHNIKEPQR